MTIVYAVLMLLFLITVHELGHFTAARLTGVPVREFAVGLGPKLVKWHSRKYATVYVIRLIPFGGYCAFYDEDDPNATDSDNPDAYHRQPVYKRLITIIMGAGMNFIVAILAAAILFSVITLYDIVPIKDSLYILSVDSASPAGAAGLMPGDQIITINDVPIDLNTPQSLIDTLNTQAALNNEITLCILRDGGELALSAVPRYVQGDAAPYKLGVTIAMRSENINPRRLSPGQVVEETFRLFASASTAVFRSIATIFTSREGIENVVGPVGIVSIIADVTADEGINAFGELLILISVNLGLMNLLPIPGLDGSRILFTLIEGIRKKPVPRRIESTIHLAGFALLLGLLVLLTYKDIVRLLGGG